MKKYHQLTYFFAAFVMSIGLIFRAVLAADRLSGIFFPKDSPFVPSFYPNDFLPWGVFLFLSAGCLFESYLFKIKKVKQRNFTLILPAILIYLIFSGLEFYLQLIYQKSGDYFGHWAYPLSELVGVWALAWIIGNYFVLMIDNYRVEYESQRVNS